MINEIASFVLTEIDNDKSCSLDVEEVEAIEKLTSFETMKCDPRSNYEHWDTFGIRNTNQLRTRRAAQFAWPPWKRVVDPTRSPSGKLFIISFITLVLFSLGKSVGNDG